jgi:prepilin-type N-terminal cleavage/methylation domain-containing protein
MSRRGFTLIELMTSTAIMIVAITATCMMLIEAQRFTRNSEEIVNSNDNARVAGEFIVNALRIAGMGGAAGLWINNGGTPRQISPISGTDNISTEGSTDDLWLILPDRRAFQDNNCVNKSGGAVSVATGGTGPLKVTCTQGLLPAGGPSPAMLMVTNFLNPGVLVTQPTPTTPSDGTVVGVIGYSESALAGFPPRAFQVGDLVYGASAVHLFVHIDATGSTLYREVGVLTGASPLAFVPTSVTRTLIQRNIEDLQFAYGTDPLNANLPDQYVYSNGFPNAAGLPARAVRVTAVATHLRSMRKGDTSLQLSSKPMSIENHTVSAPADSLRRSVYTRRVELSNLSTGSL